MADPNQEAKERIILCINRVSQRITTKRVAAPTTAVAQASASKAKEPVTLGNSVPSTTELSGQSSPPTLVDSAASCTPKTFVGGRRRVRRNATTGMPELEETSIDGLKVYPYGEGQVPNISLMEDSPQLTWSAGAGPKLHSLKAQSQNSDGPTDPGPKELDKLPSALAPLALFPPGLGHETSEDQRTPDQELVASSSPALEIEESDDETISETSTITPSVAPSSPQPRQLAPLLPSWSQVERYVLTMREQEQLIDGLVICRAKYRLLFPDIPVETRNRLAQSNMEVSLRSEVYRKIKKGSMSKSDFQGLVERELIRLAEMANNIFAPNLVVNRVLSFAP
ncbi:hypothetical protein TWF225_004087 [Orbilia oligospora]|uniref:Uncharacterized protein n=1 Tax=Orbilia oligospora TaxID=2813651 RepID=A0A8H2E1P3_ORBOL|nr:hypothetical protein TWF225_004087 [Orbilia oligospora]KAF3248148.1 hypothetical protein TWF128_008496 [Orbilia oligospora]TGJ70925.1 hypothetical protein EYR41_002935 [Orbilia oligospora]